MDRLKSSAIKTNQMQKVLRTWKEEAITEQKDYRYGYARYKEEEDDTKLDILKELCQTGADVKHLEKERGFACLPCVFWSQKLIKFFLDRGLNVNFNDEEGDTVLHQTIRNGQFARGTNETVNLIKYLLLNSANPNLSNTRGETALTLLLAKLDIASSIKKHILEVAKMLMESGASWEANSWKRNGELILLNGYGHFSIINDCKKTYRNGTIDVDARTSSLEYSKTPLMLAAAKNKMSCCRVLINMGADVNARDLQGFTALHALFSTKMDLGYNFRAGDCANLLIKMGADPDAESNSGRTCYDLCIYEQFRSEYYGIFNLGAAPAKQVEILEIMGAKQIIMESRWNSEDLYTTSWDRAMAICREFNLQPSQDFKENYQFIKENRNNPEARREIRLTAMKTISRLSKGASKLWNLLFFAGLTAEGYFHRPEPWHFFDILDFLSEELKSVGDFASLDEDHLKYLCNLIRNFKEWLDSLIKSGSKNQVTSQQISHVHSISRLTIACFEKLMHEMNNKNILSQQQNEKIYVYVCFTLTLIHSRFDDVISRTQKHESARLLRTLINLDPRDRDRNSLLHLILKDRDYMHLFGSDLMFVLLDFVDIRTRNIRGCEPVQLLYPEKDVVLDFDMFREVLIKLADLGAHADAKNEKEEATLREIFRRKLEHEVAFRYDNLQCACARVLARNTVPYANRMLPKQIVEFIRAH